MFEKIVTIVNKYRQDLQFWRKGSKAFEQKQTDF
jgi:hypothetical protein